MTYQLEQSRINEILKPLNTKLNAQPVKGVNEDDVVDLQDYSQEASENLYLYYRLIIGLER